MFPRLLMLPLLATAVLAARGESPAAFDERCIPSGGVAPPSNTLGILGRRALPAGRLARLGATRGFHHGLLAAQAPRPLPEYDSFVAATRDNLGRSQREQARFAYKERRTELRVNPFGRIGSGVVEGFEVTPVDNGAAIVRRLVERDGKPVINGEVERIERSERRPRASRKSGMEDVVAVLTFSFSHRESMQGRDVIVVHFAPRANTRPETAEGRLAKVFKGSIWVDEAAREVIRVEATAIDDISYGFGLIARLHEGTTVTLTREAIDGTTWLPTTVRFSGQGRALLFRKLVVDQRIEWFDYRRVN